MRDLSHPVADVDRDDHDEDRRGKEAPDWQRIHAHGGPPEARLTSVDGAVSCERNWEKTFAMVLRGATARPKPCSGGTGCATSFHSPPLSAGLIGRDCRCDLLGVVSQIGLVHEAVRSHEERHDAAAPVV